MKSSTARILASVIFAIAVAASAQTSAPPQAAPEQSVAPQQAAPQQPQAAPQTQSTAQTQTSSQQNVSSEGQALHILVGKSVVVNVQAPITRVLSSNPSVIETLATSPSDIDFLLLDGWKQLYLPLLRLLEPRLAAGAIERVENDTVDPREPRGQELQESHEHAVPAEGAAAPEAGVDDDRAARAERPARLQHGRAEGRVGRDEHPLDLVGAVCPPAAGWGRHRDQVVELLRTLPRQGWSERAGGRCRSSRRWHRPPTFPSSR